jgi:hypothetical protein
MHRYVALYVSMVFLAANCGSATRKATKAISDNSVPFAKSTPLPSREIASVSECAEPSECQRACEDREIQACTSWGDMLFVKEPARAEALWRDACQRRDGIACVRMMALAAAEPHMADAYARHACAYGAVNACELLGSLLMLRGLSSENEQRTALLRDAAGVFEMGCGFEHWQSCLRAGDAYQQKELAGPLSLLDRLVTRAFELATSACEDEDVDACLFRGLVFEVRKEHENATASYARACRVYLEAVSHMPYADAVQKHPCRHASELAVVPPPESLERTNSPGSLHAIEARRISGKPRIIPPKLVRTAMARSGRSRIDADVRMCLSLSGLVVSLRIVRSSEFASYDLKLLENMRTWRYSPFLIDGKPSPVCTAITFVYTQRN